MTTLENTVCSQYAKTITAQFASSCEFQSTIRHRALFNEPTLLTVSPSHIKFNDLEQLKNVFCWVVSQDLAVERTTPFCTNSTGCASNQPTATDPSFKRPPSCEAFYLPCLLRPLLSQSTQNPFEAFCSGRVDVPRNHRHLKQAKTNIQNQQANKDFSGKMYHGFYHEPAQEQPMG